MSVGTVFTGEICPGGHIYGDSIRSDNFTKETEAEELECGVCEIESVTEENSSNNAMKQSHSNSIYSSESKEDLEESSAPELGAIKPTQASCERFS